MPDNKGFFKNLNRLLGLRSSTHSGNEAGVNEIANPTNDNIIRESKRSNKRWRQRIFEFKCTSTNSEKNSNVFRDSMYVTIQSTSKIQMYITIYEFKCTSQARMKRNKKSWDGKELELCCLFTKFSGSRITEAKEQHSVS